MPLVTGHAIINGKPVINGKPATWDEDPGMMPDVLSQWRCPECEARLSTASLICLNACHLSAASFQRFQNGLAEVSARAREAAAEEAED